MPSKKPAELTGEAKVNQKIKQRLSQDYTYNGQGQRVNKHELFKQTIANAKKITGHTADYQKLKQDMDKEVNKEAQSFHDQREVMREKQKQTLERLSKQIKKETPARLKPQGKQIFDSSPRDEISQRIEKGGY